jgi:protein gp37
MAENSKIEWCDHTFNPWIGCQKVSAACDNCYAEAWDHRFGGHRWGPGAQRTRTSIANWRKPIGWNKAAATAGARHKVFCASLADVFDNQVPDDWRADLWQLIRDTPNLDWQLLTKRPQNIPRFVPDDWENYDGGGYGYPNVWLGTTVENQAEADRRVEALVEYPAVAHFLSCEPLLEPVVIPKTWLGRRDPKRHKGTAWDWTGINWVIAGAESGPGARPMDPDWARDIRDQCKAAGVPFFMKQMTGKAPIPDDLLVRQFPTPQGEIETVREPPE